MFNVVLIWKQIWVFFKICILKLEFDHQVSKNKYMFDDFLIKTLSKYKKTNKEINNKLTSEIYTKNRNWLKKCESL